MRFAVRYREDAPVRVAVGALVLLALAIGLTYFFHTADAGRFGFGTALAWALAMLGLAVLFIAVLLMRESRPTVRLGLDGLLDRRWSAKPIGWSNIAEFDPVHWFGIPVRWWACAWLTLRLIRRPACLHGSPVPSDWLHMMMCWCWCSALIARQTRWRHASWGLARRRSRWRRKLRPGRRAASMPHHRMADLHN